METGRGKSKSPIGKVILGIIVLFIGFMVYNFASGELQFIETLKMPGETRGYLGRRSKILDSEEKFEKIMEELQTMKEFQGKDITFKSIFISKNRILAVIQDPNNEKYYDEYNYNGNALSPKWVKQDPYTSDIVFPDFKFSDLNVKGIYKFFSQIVDYTKNNNIELKEEPNINVNIYHQFAPTKELQLTGYAEGVREGIYFKSDLNGDNFHLSD